MHGIGERMSRIMIDGKSLNEIAEENGLSIGTVRHRYVMGDRSYERLSRRAEKRGNHVRHTFYAANQGERLRDVFLHTNITFAELSRRTGIKPTTNCSSILLSTLPHNWAISDIELIIK